MPSGKQSPAEAQLVNSVGAVPRLIDILDRFCSEHTQFESSTVISLVRDDMAAAVDINTAALVPLRHKIFGFETALLWGFFLSQAAESVLGDENVYFAEAFSVAQYHIEVGAIYDLAVAAQVWDLVEDDDDVDDE